jgi:hypothetical protein
MKVKCPVCETVQSLPDEYSNKQIKCRNCEKQFQANPHIGDLAPRKHTTILPKGLLIVGPISCLCIYFAYRYYKLPSQMGMVLWPQLTTVPEVNIPPVIIEHIPENEDFREPFASQEVIDNQWKTAKKPLVEQMQNNISKFEALLFEREREVEEIENELIQYRQDHAAELGKISRDDKWGRMKYDAISKIFDDFERDVDEMLSIQRAEISKSWERVENYRNIMRIVKNTDDPDLALELVKIEKQSQDELAEIQKDYEERQKRNEKESERTQRAGLRQLERELSEIDRKYPHP